MVTALTLFLLQDIEGGLSLVIRLTVQTVASCVLGGTMVGVILPLMAVEGVGLHAALAAVVGSVAYSFMYHLAVPPFFLYVVFDVIGNLAGAAIGGFVGGVASSSV